MKTDLQAANRSIGNFYGAMRDFGQKRARNLGILLAVVIAFSIYALVTDGMEPLLPTRRGRSGQRLHLLGDGSRARADLQGDDRRQLRAG
jgi:hypothetical protein